jgi:hypothetical protein
MPQCRTASHPDDLSVAAGMTSDACVHPRAAGSECEDLVEGTIGGLGASSYGFVALEFPLPFSKATPHAERFAYPKRIFQAV